MTRVLVVDNYDSFVYTLNGYVEQLGAETVVVQNDGIALDDLFYLNPRRSPNPEDAQAFTGEVLNLSRGNR